MVNQRKMKQAVEDALEANDLEAVLTLALGSRRVLSVLVRLAYDKETLVGWRAIKAIGRVASVFVMNNYDFLRETVRKLLWSLSDESGGIGWAAPEILGEIVSADPKKMADVVPLIAEAYFLEEKVFRPGVLYAFNRIAETCPEAVRPFEEIVLNGLSEQDTLARIYAIELAGRLGAQVLPENRERISKHLKGLMQDNAEAWVYRNAGFEGIEVAEIAKEVYKRLSFSH